MSKTVLQTKFQELKGLDRISQVVHEMNCFFRELSKDDVGIDGEIEVLTPQPDRQGWMTTGGFIKVQAKSGSSFVTYDSVESFSSPVKRADLEYWNSIAFPIILVVYHPADDKLYFKEIHGYIQSTPDVWKPPCRVTFDKAADEFGVASREKLCELASISPPRVTHEKKEKLFFNLFQFKKISRIVFSAPSDYSDVRQLREQSRSRLPPFLLEEGTIYTLADLRATTSGLRNFCNTARISEVPLETWMGTDVGRRNFVYLANRVLSDHLYRIGILYQKGSGVHYFPRRDDQSQEFKTTWRNVRTGRSSLVRTIVKHYRYGIDDFWRHTAGQFTFKQFGANWYLQIIPKYVVTSDGREAYDPSRIGPLVTKVKARENNLHTLTHVLFWADVLSSGQTDIELRCDNRLVMVIEKAPYSGVAGFAIMEDPADFEEPIESEQPSFISQLFDTMGDGGSGDDDDLIEIGHDDVH